MDSSCRSPPEPPPGRPLIYTGDARRSIESQPVHTRIPVGISLFLTYNTSCTSGRFTATGSKPATGLGPSSVHTTNEVIPAQAGRFTPSGNIPNRSPTSRHGHEYEILISTLGTSYMLRGVQNVFEVPVLSREAWCT